MRRFQKILLLASNSVEMKQTLERAAELAESNKARLTVVDVLKESSKTPFSLSGPEAIAAGNRLEQLIAPIRDRGVRIDATVLIGIPFIEIIRHVLIHQYDLVIKTATGVTGAKARIFGSTALHLMRKCPCPVWITKPIKHYHYAKIMAAIDPDTWDATKAGLNRMIMELAASLAIREGSELHVVQAWNPYKESLIPDNAALRGTEKESGEPKIHKKIINELLAGYRAKGFNPQVHLIEGKAEGVIPSLAREKNIELIIMGTVGRVGISGLFIGNTAEEVLNHVDCAVLTVKPEGFVTPVTI